MIGRPATEFPVLDVAQARAEAREGTSGGEDGMLLEMCERLPDIMLLKVWRLFQERLQKRDSYDPHFRKKHLLRNLENTSPAKQDTRDSDGSPRW